MEIWREVQNGYYEVSNHGRVRRKKPGKSTVPGHVLSIAQHQSNRGRVYARVSLWCKNKKTDAYVHRLVAHTFIGSCPIGFEVNHKDGNPLNNHVSNLEYVTSAQNKQHFHLLNRGLISGENHWKAKLKEVDVVAIRLLCSNGFPQMYVAKLFDVRRSTIEKIVLNLRWRR